MSYYFSWLSNAQIDSLCIFGQLCIIAAALLYFSSSAAIFLRRTVASIRKRVSFLLMPPGAE